MPSTLDTRTQPVGLLGILQPGQAADADDEILGGLLASDKNLRGVLAGLAERLSKIDDNADLTDEGKRKKRLKVGQEVIAEIETATAKPMTEASDAVERFGRKLQALGLGKPSADPADRLQQVLEDREIRAVLSELDDSQRWQAVRDSPESQRAILRAPNVIRGALLPAARLGQLEQLVVESAHPEHFSRRAEIAEARDRLQANIDRVREFVTTESGLDDDVATRVRAAGEAKRAEAGA